jgi:hypothetical protein
MRPMIDATWLTPFNLTDKEPALAEQERVRAEARTEQERVWAKALAEVGITPPEAALFHVVHYGMTASPTSLPSAAACPDYSLVEPVREPECQAALTACLARGWLQVIDEPVLAKIVDELREGQFLGPIYGLPEVGGVDFTHAGAVLWRRLSRHRFPNRPSPDFAEVVHSKTSRYFRTRTAALRGIEEATQWDGDITVVGPCPIGPWRAQWWRRFSKGYRIEIEERRHWQGRCGEGDGCFMPRPTCQGANPRRLQHILDCHNVTLAEWLLLATMDPACGTYASRLPRWVADSAHRSFGVTTSEDECRAGLDACLRYGWLTLAQNAGDEVDLLLAADPATMPVAPEVRGWDEVDFTPCGATLYRMIAAEWLGSDWEDNLMVWKETYREEHRYCEATEGLQGIEQGYAASGEIIRASKVVPIGPWCVYWWERFPAGYRLELQIGEP